MDTFGGFEPDTPPDIKRELCQDCGSLSFSKSWQQNFGVRFCNDCRAAYSLIAKGNAKERYALTDRDLAKLGTLTKTNPRKEFKAAADMKLYLECQVQEVSMAKHGSMDELEMKLERQRTAKSGPAKAAKAKAQERKDAQLQARVGRITKQIAAAEPRCSTILAAGATCANAGSDAEEI